MEVSEQFSLTLTNDSINFADNSIYSFRSLINPPIEIPFKKFEVGVSKVILPKTTKPYLPPAVFVIGFAFEDWIPRGFRRRYEREITVEGGVFDSVEHMLEHIETSVVNSFMKFYEENPHFYNVETGRLPGVVCKLKMLQNQVTFHKVELTAFPEAYPYKSFIRLVSGLDMWQVIGFQSFTTRRIYDLPIRARFPPFLNVIMSALVLYAPNLVVDQLIGDQVRPVLELIPYNANTAEQFLIYSVTNPIYRTVIGGYINRIHIEIEEVSSKPLYFDPGKVQIHLHFRPCQQLTNQ